MARAPRSPRRGAARAAAGRLAPGRPDLRRTVRRALRTGGEPLERARRERRRRPRRLVLLLDVSGSMSAYSRALLVFAHAALRADRRWEAFCFGTRLTRLTRALASSDPDQALLSRRRPSRRLGRRHADRRDAARRSSTATATAASPAARSSSSARTASRSATRRSSPRRWRGSHRLAHAVVWLNPLKERPGLRAARARACTPRSRTSTCSSAGTTSPASRSSRAELGQL